MKRKLDDLRHELNDSAIFKEIYKYSYDFAKVCYKKVKVWCCNFLQDKDQRSMDLELAIGMLTLLLANRWNLQADFIAYLKVCLLWYCWVAIVWGAIIGTRSIQSY